MEIKECECGDWGWYLNDANFTMDEKEFFVSFILLSFKYGINISTYGIQHGINHHKYSREIVDKIFLFVDQFEGNNLQQAINYNFFSKDLNRTVLPLVVYDGDSTVFSQRIYYDIDSTIFCTLKNGRFHSVFYKLQTNVFLHRGIDKNPFYSNLCRFNSYIRSLNELMTKSGFPSLSCSIYDIGPAYKLTDKGYISHLGEVLFYEDVYDLLPINLRYLPFAEIDLPFRN